MLEVNAIDLHYGAAQALRGLVETMIKRRGRLEPTAVDAANAGVDE